MMDQDSLITLVTQLVMEELSKSGSAVAPVSTEANGAPLRKILICGAPGSACEQAAWDALRSFKGVHWQIIDWPGYPAARLAKHLGDAPKTVISNLPELWDDLVRNVEGVILPFAPIDILAKTSQLIVDVPPVAAAVAALIQGTPVFFGGDDAERLTRHSARIPRAVISVAQEHARSVQSLGIMLDTPAQLVAHLSGGVAVLAHSSPNGSRDVVTNEDVMAVYQAGQNYLDVTPGSIVTSLAQETAARFGIEVRFR